MALDTKHSIEHKDILGTLARQQSTMHHMDSQLQNVKAENKTLKQKLYCICTPPPLEEEIRRR